MARKVFYSFHYDADCERVAQVRNMGVVEGSPIASDNSWEQIKREGDRAIQAWIERQMKCTSCCVVLVGKETANRKWVIYEISEAWNQNKGVVGIHIYELINFQGEKSTKGENPLDKVTFNKNGIPLSSVAKTYDPPQYDSKEVYAHIKANLTVWIEEALRIRAAAG